ncbi:MAG: hypothetical protein AB7O24_11235 [Kofleriaceae bacterium]
MKVVLLLGVCACTSFGPMPTTTGLSAVPTGRPGGEIQGALIPSFRLSDAASGNDRNNQQFPQLAALFEPDRWLKAPGLALGGRVWGKKADVGVEPLVGYRTRLGGRISIAGMGFGTRLSSERYGAKYAATRIGGELAVDAMVWAPLTWLSIHTQAAVAATYVSATGHYCIDDVGNGIDCSEAGPNTFVDGYLQGVYPAVTATLALDVTPAASWFHSARIALMGAAGHMPRVIAGHQQWGDRYATLGVALALGFGAPE